MSEAKFLHLSKNNSFFVIHGNRSCYKTKSHIKKVINFFELVNSPFFSLRLFQDRYFQSRLIILKKLKKININLADVKVSISHNRYSFIALVSRKHVDISVDHEPNERYISNALRNKISKTNKPDSLSLLGFINIVETLVKITNQKWSSIMANFEIKSFDVLPNVYVINLGKETIYSKFYRYNDNQICISTNKLEILK